MNSNSIPNDGLSEEEVFKNLNSLRDEDVGWKSGKAFGAVYYPGDAYAEVILKAYNLYVHENAFDPQLFKSLLTMEKDIVHQVGQLFANDQSVYGSLTSGGTESIFLALLSARDWSKEIKKIDNPEVIISSTAHPAFLKAMRFLKIKPIVIDANTELKLDISGFKKAINNNTILMVGSAPAYPYGMMDPIDELSDLAVKNNLLLHVDACIGGFLLSYLKRIGYNIPLFDFSLVGVTSISVDLHKYAYAPKGSSVLLYKNSDLRKSQFSVYANWQGGIYASTSFLGTKPGGIVASSWTALNHIGHSGYIKLAKKTMQATNLIKHFLENHVDLYLIGNPIMSILAFSSKSINIYHIADCLNDLGWYVGRLQNPEGIHLVVSQVHNDGAAQEFINDLEDVTIKLKSKSFKKMISSIEDNLSSKILNLMSFNKAKQTILKTVDKQSSSPNKKRIIYNVKQGLKEEQTNDLFRSIMDRFYK
jgi:glutamate/tyrosine decarboxylase-like PLP-dependent enzyme